MYYIFLRTIYSLDIVVEVAEAVERLVVSGESGQVVTSDEAVTQYIMITPVPGAPHLPRPHLLLARHQHGDVQGVLLHLKISDNGKIINDYSIFYLII